MNDFNYLEFLGITTLVIILELGLSVVFNYLALFIYYLLFNKDDNK